MLRILVAPALFAAAAYGGTTELAKTCNTGLDTALPPGRELRMEVRPAGIEIVGTDTERLRITCRLRHPEDAADVQIRFTPSSAGGQLRIKGGPMDDTELRIEVPRHTHLHLRILAGEVKVRQVVGNKDIGLRAGELTIDVDDPAEYREADASVRIGELSAPLYGVSKGGFFRSFRKTRTDGKYRLNARLTVGELRLR
jgi:hypothetical protein